MMKKAGIVILIIAIIFIGGILWWNINLQPVDAKDTTKKIFIVKPGENIRDMANNLKSAGLIRDPVVFFLLVKQKGIENKIQAGDFRLSPSQSIESIAETLTHGVLDVWVTVPDGKRAEEIAAIFKEKLPSYEDSWEAALKENEGYLFPDTYLIPRSVDSAFVIQLMRKNFEDHLVQLSKIQQTDPPLTNEQKVILASLIEREARYADDKHKVASVIYNRLKLGMALQIDATVQYAVGYDTREKSWWKHNLTIDDLKINSPFNSYTNTGLPPHPIGSPGFSSLTAAFQPAETDYLYYVSDAAGHLHFGRTNEDHNKNIEKYLNK